MRKLLLTLQYYLCLLVALLTASLSYAQNDKKTFQISGNVPDGISKIYIYKSNGLSAREMLDSTAVADGRFAISGKRPAYDLLSIGSGSMSIQFFNDGEPLTMDFVNDSLSASPLNEKFYRYNKEDDRFSDEFYRLYISRKNTKDEANKIELEQQIAANQEASHEHARAIIRDNLDNVIAAYYLDGVNDFMDYEELKSTIDSTAYYYNHPLLNTTKARLKMLSSRQIGNTFCDDVILLSPDGKKHRLSEWCGQGKYVLIDFWASWCRPCRMEMPNVINNYERFRDNGFEVLAVSIDDKMDAWKSGIKSFGTPFIQLSELQGRKSRLCAIYGISTIPANLLIDPQGKIIAADLRERTLTRRLESILK